MAGGEEKEAGGGGRGTGRERREKLERKVMGEAGGTANDPSGNSTEHSYINAPNTKRTTQGTRYSFCVVINSEGQCFQLIVVKLFFNLGH